MRDSRRPGRLRAGARGGGLSPETERRILADIEAARVAGGQVHADTGLGDDPVPSDVYADPQRYRAEVERVFHRAWVPVARQDEVPRSGWVLRDVAGAAVVVTRDAGWTLHAFHNTCRHRGSAVVSGDGCGDRLVCPYHAWTYRLDGRLAAVPDPGSCAPGALDGIALRRVGVEVAWGWVWVRVTDDGPPLVEFLGPDLEDELAEWSLGTLEHKGRLARDGAFDWKVGVEGFLEPYHVPSVHKRSVHPVVQHKHTAMGWFGDHSRMAIPLRDPGMYAPDGFLGKGAAAVGIGTIRGLNELQRTTNLVYLVWPATILNLLPNHAVWLQLVPVGPGRSRLVLDILGERSADDAQRDWWGKLVASYEALADEDSAAFAGVQRGLAGPNTPPLVLTHYDRRIRQFRGRLAAWLGP